jgi:hypothetical protein
MIFTDYFSFKSFLHCFIQMTYALSEDLKWRIVYLYFDGYSRKKISELLYISRSCVDKVLQIYSRWGTVINPWQKSPDRNKTLSCDDMKVIIYKYKITTFICYQFYCQFRSYEI